MVPARGRERPADLDRDHSHGDHGVSGPAPGGGATRGQAGRRAAAVASLVIGYAASVWPPWLIGSPGHASARFAVWLAVLLLFLLAVAEVIRARGQRRLR